MFSRTCFQEDSLSESALGWGRTGNLVDSKADVSTVVASIDALKCTPPDFCLPRQFVASSPEWGYIESSPEGRAMLTSNMGRPSTRTMAHLTAYPTRVWLKPYHARILQRESGWNAP